MNSSLYDRKVGLSADFFYFLKIFFLKLHIFTIFVACYLGGKKSPEREEQKMKHKVTIRVADERGSARAVVRGAQARIPTRLVRFLFGGYTNVYLLTPGQSVESVNIVEVKEGNND